MTKAMWLCLWLSGWLVPGEPFRATVEVKPEPLEPVNRRVLGVCVMYPPFEELEPLIARLFGRTSARLWARENEQWWRQLLPALRALEPCRTLAFVDKSWHPEKVVYRSAQDNNLFPWQQVPAVVKRVEFALQQLRRHGIELEGPLYWEVWNEPQFAQNGGWDPEGLARYANDCARALRRGSPCGWAFLCTWAMWAGTNAFAPPWMRR
jgi:hypothetical protein